MFVFGWGVKERSCFVGKVMFDVFVNFCDIFVRRFFFDLLVVVKYGVS